MGGGRAKPGRALEDGGRPLLCSVGLGLGLGVGGGQGPLSSETRVCSLTPGVVEAQRPALMSAFKAPSPAAAGGGARRRLRCPYPRPHALRPGR